VIHDGSGGQTTVVLGDMVRDVRLNDESFVIPGKNRMRMDR
jgi:hypothetical protein